MKTLFLCYTISLLILYLLASFVVWDLFWIKDVPNLESQVRFLMLGILLFWLFVTTGVWMVIEE